MAAAGRATLIANKAGAASIDDMWVQLGNASGDVKLGHFEAADLFPLINDTLVPTRMLHWRRGHAALRKGAMQMLPVHAQVLAFVRSHGDEQILCVFNFSPDSVQWELPATLASAQPMPDSPAEGGSVSSGLVVLQPWGGFFGRL